MSTISGSGHLDTVRCAPAAIRSRRYTVRRLVLENASLSVAVADSLVPYRLAGLV